ncbi:unnamed protein product [Schistosoma margrebowiei]|uniref:Uncharacterized protein n=1 Tax=Schistosoma margrebowiei TaxID=48269 RepID=A0A183LJF7_9TREM|nr:unnamed protein product [Schistosoma margrebowiei]
MDDQDFTHDLDLPSHMQQQMKEKTISVAVTSAALCLNIHNGKSKILPCTTACNNPITIDGEDLKDVKSFTYVSNMIDEHSGSDTDVNARIGKARSPYLQPKNIWNSKQLSTNIEVRIFNTHVKTVLLSAVWKPAKLRKPSSRKYKCLLTVVYTKYFGSVGQTLSETT